MKNVDVILIENMQVIEKLIQLKVFQRNQKTWLYDAGSTEH